MAWNFVLADITKKPIGEILQAKERNVTLSLNKLDSASFKLRLDNPLADTVMTTACYVKAYRDSKLQFFGPVVAAEETAEGLNQSISVTASSSGWVLNKRYAGKLSPPASPITAGTDKAQAVVSMLNDANLESATGVIPHTSPAPTAGTNLASALVVGPYKKILDQINELALALDGFDWRILPRENWVGGAFNDQHAIGTFYAQGTIGTTRPGAIFEWGAGRNNIASYSRVVNRDSQATRIFHHVTEGPNAPGYPTVQRDDATAQATWGILEETADADLHDLTLRNALGDLHLSIRKNPKQTITFVPHIDPARTGRLPNYDVDYTLGDTVIARARSEGITRFNVGVRVYAVSFALDDVSGMERATLTLVDEG